jgi:putative CocE/NonD family hydrolase
MRYVKMLRSELRLFAVLRLRASRYAQDDKGGLGRESLVMRKLCCALALCFGVLLPPSVVADSRYIIDDNVLIHLRDGATVSAIVVRPGGVTAKLPAALVFTIYADPAHDLERMKYAADRGYAGVIAYSRGKLNSPDRIAPYEYDGRDADGVIGWIAKQPWSNGKAGMYGGSYNGFTQWAATKYMNPALKTIVPWVAENPGNGLPMQDNVFLLVNYAWVYYVTDNKLLDDALYRDPRWRALNDTWYASGRSYRDVPAVAGMPNPWLEKWLRHLSYDGYWQAMLPYRSDFARINIPVLSITGYYDDGQVSALGFYKDHYSFNRFARDYLVIGPWDHFNSQHSVKDDVIRGYRIDPAAHINTPRLTFDWFDYVMRGKPRPALVADRVNYEVMGANVWRHASSIGTMGARSQRFYLTDAKVGRRYYLLTPREPASVRGLLQRVDFADRKTSNNDSYPDPIVGRKPDFSNGYLFATQPFSETADVSGVTGAIRAVANKRDVDLGIALYEISPDGRLFELSDFIGRASYAADMSKRTLLTPGKPFSVSLDQMTLFSKRVEKGSRLLLSVNVNKNAFAEINYGTGRDVSGEDIHDASVPLQVRWLTSSYIDLRL